MLLAAELARRGGFFLAVSAAAKSSVPRSRLGASERPALRECWLRHDSSVAPRVGSRAPSKWKRSGKIGTVAREEGERDRRVDLGEQPDRPCPEALELGPQLVGERDPGLDEVLSRAVSARSALVSSASRTSARKRWESVRQSSQSTNASKRSDFVAATRKHGRACRSARPATAGRRAARPWLGVGRRTARRR